MTLDFADMLRPPFPKADAAKALSLIQQAERAVIAGDVVRFAEITAELDLHASAVALRAAQHRDLVLS